MSTVDYIPFATGGGASVMSQPNYITNAPTGVVPGLADPTFANKSWRQSSMIAAAVANFISTTLGINVLDDGNLSTLIANLTAALEVAASNGLALGMNAPTNLQIASTEGSNNLTIAIKGTNGSDPSATNPVTIPFRDPTAANGDLVARQVTAALSFTINSGNTMGVASNNQPFRLWVFAMDNGGTVLLGAVLCSTASQIFPLNESTPQTATGTNGGSTAGVFYANAAASAKSIRILGYIEFGNGLANIGVWATAFTKIQLFGPGQRKPGDVVQALYCSTTTTTTSNGATKVNLSGFSPSPVINVSSSPNLVRVRLVGNATINYSTGASGQVNLFRGTNATTIGTTSAAGAGTSEAFVVGLPVVCEALDQPATAGNVTYGGYVLATGASMIWLSSSGVGVGGTGLLTIEEIMG